MCYELTDITIPDSVKTIDDDAFNECVSLSSVSIPSSIKIEGNAFKDCSSINNMTVTASGEGIAYNRFSDNGKAIISPNNIIIEDGIKSIDGYSFMNENLKSITIPKSVTKIGERAFGYHLEYDKTQYDYSYAYNYFYNDSFSVYGYRNTAAETYANDNGFTFIPLDDNIKKGDINGDEKLNATDLLLVKSHIKGVKLLTGDALKAADVDENGKVNASDLLKMKAHIKGVSKLW